MQFLAPPSSHASHDPAHPAHVAAPVLVSEYRPSGHELTQVLTCLMGAEPSHVVQSFTPLPEHVWHAALHIWQVREASAWYPLGHSVRHTPWWKIGVSSAHEMQLAEVLHEAHVLSQSTHWLFSPAV